MRLLKAFPEKRPASHYEDNKPRWRCRYEFDDGKGKQSGPTFTKLAEAKDWCAKLRTDVNQGTWVDQAQARVTVKEYAASWRADRVRFRRHRPATARRVRMLFETHVDPHLGDIPMGAVRPSHLQNWLLAFSQVIARGTFESSVVYVEAIFRQAHADGDIGRNPWNSEVKLARQSILASYPATPARPLPTLDEVSRLAEALPPHLAAAAWVAARTGLRPGELLGLCVGAGGNVDLLRKTIRVDRQLWDTEMVYEVKTKASLRTVPIDQGTVDIIAAHLAAYPALEDGRVFRSLPWGQGRGSRPRNGPLTESAFNNQWLSARARAGVPDYVRLHDMRSVYASALRHQGASLELIDRVLGHKPAMSRVDAAYLRPVDPDDDDNRIRACVAAFFDGAEAQEEVAK